MGYGHSNIDAAKWRKTMGQFIDCRKRFQVRRQTSPSIQGRSADILFYTGVRYERLPAQEAHSSPNPRHEGEKLRKTGLAGH